MTFETTEILLDRPLCVGAAILDLSKVYMLTFWYKALKPALEKKNLKLLYSDTDSLIFQVETDDIYRDIYASPSIRQWFDLSSLPSTHPCIDIANAGRHGVFKDEMKGQNIKEAIFLRAKMYSVASLL